MKLEKDSSSSTLDIAKIRDDVESSLIRSKIIGVNSEVHRKLCSRLAPADKQEKSKKIRPPFGVPLESLPCVNVELRNGLEATVPRVVCHLVELIAAQATETQLVFRKAGSATRARFLEEKLRQNGDITGEDYSVHDVVGVLRTLLKELPIPVIPKYHTNLFKKCVRKSDQESALKVALLLPEVHLSVLCVLSDLFSSIASHFDVTHMDSRSLSIVMAPTLLFQEKVGGSEADLKLYYPAILQVLIDNSEKLGVLPAKKKLGVGQRIVSLAEFENEKSGRLNGRDRRTKSVTRTITKMKNWMQRREEEGEESASATPAFERNSRISASAVSDRKRKKKRFLTPTRDPGVGQSKFYDSDEGPPVAEKQPKLMTGGERMSRRELWVELQNAQDVQVPAPEPVESSEGMDTESSEPGTPVENVQKAFVETWRKSESLRAELSPMLTNRSRKGRSPSQRRIDRRRSASAGAAEASDGLQMLTLSTPTPQTPNIRTPLAPLSQGRFHSLRRNKPNTVGTGLPLNFRSSQRSAMKATPLRVASVVEEDPESPSQMVENIEPVRRKSSRKSLDAADVTAPNPELDKETAENQARAFLALAEESWVPATDVFGKDDVTNKSCCHEDVQQHRRKKHRRHRADQRRARTTIVGPGILPVRLKHRKSVSSSQLPKKPFCSPSAGQWVIEPVVEFRVPKTPAPPPAPSASSSKNSSGRRPTPAEVKKKLCEEKWTPGPSFFNESVLGPLSQSERKPAVRDSVARIREENCGKVRALAQRYDKDAVRRDSFVAPTPKTLFK